VKVLTERSPGKKKSIKGGIKMSKRRDDLALGDAKKKGEEERENSV